jgi:hypothetical protein
MPPPAPRGFKLRDPTNSFAALVRLTASLASGPRAGRDSAPRTPSDPTCVFQAKPWASYGHGFLAPVPQVLSAGACSPHAECRIFSSELSGAGSAGGTDGGPGRARGGVGGRIRATRGWISVDRGSKATLPLTMPRRVFKSSAKDSTCHPSGVCFREATRGSFAARAYPQSRARGGLATPTLGRRRTAGASAAFLAWILT